MSIEHMLWAYKNIKCYDRQTDRQTTNRAIDSPRRQTGLQGSYTSNEHIGDCNARIKSIVSHWTDSQAPEMVQHKNVWSVKYQWNMRLRNHGQYLQNDTVTTGRPKTIAWYVVHDKENSSRNIFWAPIQFAYIFMLAMRLWLKNDLWSPSNTTWTHTHTDWLLYTWRRPVPQYKCTCITMLPRSKVS